MRRRRPPAPNPADRLALTAVVIAARCGFVPTDEQRRWMFRLARAGGLR